MKKNLLTILVLGVLTLAPIKSLAMLEVDENGKPIEREVKPGEFTTMMAPDEGVSSDGSQSVEPSKPADGSQSTEPAKATDDVLYTTTGVEEDNYRTVSAEKSSNELLAAKDEEKSLTTIIFSGGTGALLGILGTILVLSRRK